MKCLKLLCISSHCHYTEYCVSLALLVLLSFGKFLVSLKTSKARPVGVGFRTKTFFGKVKWRGRKSGWKKEESCDTKEPEKRRLIGREENLEKKGKGRGGFGRFGADHFLRKSFGSYIMI